MLAFTLKIQPYIPPLEVFTGWNSNMDVFRSGASIITVSLEFFNCTSSFTQKMDTDKLSDSGREALHMRLLLAPAIIGLYEFSRSKMNMIGLPVSA